VFLGGEKNADYEKKLEDHREDASIQQLQEFKNSAQTVFTALQDLHQRGLNSKDTTLKQQLWKDFEKTWKLPAFNTISTSEKYSNIISQAKNLSQSFQSLADHDRFFFTGISPVSPNDKTNNANPQQINKETTAINHQLTEFQKELAALHIPSSQANTSTALASETQNNLQESGARAPGSLKKGPVSKSPNSVTNNMNGTTPSVNMTPNNEGKENKNNLVNNNSASTKDPHATPASNKSSASVPPAPPKASAAATAPIPGRPKTIAPAKGADHSEKVTK
jgi:hypothetical protein